MLVPDSAKKIHTLCYQQESESVRLDPETAQRGVQILLNTPAKGRFYVLQARHAGAVKAQSLKQPSNSLRHKTKGYLLPSRDPQQLTLHELQPSCLWNRDWVI